MHRPLEVASMQTVKFRTGDTIMSEGESGNSAFLIVSGSVEVSVGQEANAKTVGTLGAGEVFGEMCLIEPAPRSATVKAVTDAECVATSYDEFIPSMQNDPQRAMTVTKSLVRRLRETNNLLSIAPAEVLGRRIQQSLQVILAGLEGRDALSGADLEGLERELRMLLNIDRIHIATAEIDKAEQVLQYMLRPNIEECLNLWFGKSEQTDHDIFSRFGADVALASRGHYDHWALNVEHPRLLVGLVIMLDQFTRNMYRDTPQMYACDARCQGLVKRGLRVGMSARLHPIERVFLCLALTHSEALDDQLLCMDEWGQAMEELPPDDPLNVFDEIFQRHVRLRRCGEAAHGEAARPRVRNPAAEHGRGGAQGVRVQVLGTGRRLH